MARKSTKVNFESSIAELEELVEKMESGEYSLEDSLKQFERGISLARACQKALRDAEQKIQLLTRDDQGNDSLEAFEPEDDG